MLLLTVIVLGLLALFMLAGGIPLPDADVTLIFRTPAFLALTGLLAVLLILGCARYGRGKRRLIFWPAHFGALLILTGAILSAALATQGQLILPVGGWHTVDHLRGPSGQPSTPLGFRLSVSDFEVDFYDAPDTQGRTPREFRATLLLQQDDSRDIRLLRVNHPISINQWRIYLMSYGDTPRRYVQLLVRRDPGRPLIAVGIGLVIIGTALLCWRRRGGATC